MYRYVLALLACFSFNLSVKIIAQTGRAGTSPSDYKYEENKSSASSNNVICSVPSRFWNLFEFSDKLPLASLQVNTDGSLAFVCASGNELLLGKRDPEENPVWTKYWGYKDTGFEIQGFSHTSDGGYAILTRSQDFSLCMLMKFSDAGNLMWALEFVSDPGDLIQLEAMAESKAGGLILAGSIVHAEKEAKALVIKLNRYGNMLWGRTYGTEQTGIVKGLAPLPDGSVYVLGSTRDKGEGGNNGFLIMKLSGLGMLDWARGIHNAMADISDQIMLAPDGGALVLGHSTSDEHPIHFLVNFNRDGRMLWAGRYDDIFDDKKLTSFSGCLENQTLYMFGTICHSVGYDDYKGNILLMRINPGNGEIKDVVSWEREVGEMSGKISTAGEKKLYLHGYQPKKLNIQNFLIRLDAQYETYACPQLPVRFEKLEDWQAIELIPQAATLVFLRAVKVDISQFRVRDAEMSEMK